MYARGREKKLCKREKRSLIDRARVIRVSSERSRCREGAKLGAWQISLRAVIHQRTKKETAPLPFRVNDEMAIEN